LEFGIHFSISSDKPAKIFSDQPHAFMAQWIKCSAADAEIQVQTPMSEFYIFLNLYITVTATIYERLSLENGIRDHFDTL
jgi:hypothetical protein